MREVHPEVFLIAEPSLNWDAIRAYLTAVNGIVWADRDPTQEHGLTDAEALIEFMGRLCYRSWEPGLNPNVTKVRTDSVDYLMNIVSSEHGSVLEHAQYSFVFHNVSRVFTHELVRHRVGTAISQESMRYVRLTDIPMATPEFVEASPRLREMADQLLAHTEAFFQATVEETGIENPGVPFAVKKQITSAMRRYAPDGVATTIGWSANVRTLRHVIELRTALGAEAEMRDVFDQVGHIMYSGGASPLFADFVREENGVWAPRHRKV
jgi:thymidylate synthase (FAD)